MLNIAYRWGDAKQTLRSAWYASQCGAEMLQTRSSADGGRGPRTLHAAGGAQGAEATQRHGVSTSHQVNCMLTINQVTPVLGISVFEKQEHLPAQSSECRCPCELYS